MTHHPQHLDPLDRIVQDHAPVVMVPNRTTLFEMRGYGHRFLAAQDGLWLDVNAPVGQFRLHIAPSEMSLPYGAVAASTVLSFGRITEHLPLIREFINHAERSLPNEAAAWLVWDAFDKTMRLQILEPTAASPGSITFARPTLDEHECIAIDIHSHGRMSAFFSSTDDRDDQGETKVSMVIGNVDGELTVAARLCVLGQFVDIPITAEVLK